MERPQADLGDFPTCTQTLYRLRSNSFPLWNWAAQDLSCPHLQCVRGQSTPASHVFWSCSGAQRHWEQLLFSLWRCLGSFEETDKHLWVFGMELPGIPRDASRLRAFLGRPGICSELDQTCFPLRASCGVSSLHQSFMPSGSSGSIGWRTQHYRP